MGAKGFFDPFDTRLLCALHSCNLQKSSCKRAFQKGHMSFNDFSDMKKYTKKHLKKYPFCTKMKINIEKGTCVLF